MINTRNWVPNKFVFDKITEKWLPNVNYPGISNHSYIVALNQINVYQEFIKKYIKGILLDCGCGDVPYYGIYRNNISDVYCVDWENSGTKQAHVDQFVNLNERLDLPDNYYDSVLLSDVLEHIAEPDLLINELNRLLKSEGHLLIMVPFLYRIHEEPHDYYRYTEFALKYLLEKNGFKVIELKSYGGGIDVIFDLINKIFFNTKKRSRLLFKIYNYLINKSIFQRKNIERMYSFPLGYCLAAQKNA